MADMVEVAVVLVEMEKVVIKPTHSVIEAMRTRVRGEGGMQCERREGGSERGGRKGGQEVERKTDSKEGREGGKSSVLFFRIPIRFEHSDPDISNLL